MKRFFFFFLLLLLYLSGSYNILCANNTDGNNDRVTIEQSNKQLSFNDFLDGVRYAYVELDPQDQERIDRSGSILFDHFANYLIGLGFEAVALTSTQKAELRSKAGSLCDIAKVKIEVAIGKETFSDHIMQFSTCQKDYFRFHCPDVLQNDVTLLNELYGVWTSMCNYKITYNKAKRLELPVTSRSSDWTEKKLLKYFEQKKVAPLEGVYEKILESEVDKTKYKVALKRDQNGNYDVIYLSGARNYEDWGEGELIGQVTGTSGSPSHYKASWYLPDKSLEDEVYMSVDRHNMIYFAFPKAGNLRYKYFKLFPKKQTQSEQKLKATGTGIAISADGYIVTSYHVIEGGDFLEVNINEGDYTASYNARLVVKDVNNDLAVLKIDDIRFEGLPDISYSFGTQAAQVGENVFTLGYPLITSMGSELKLTDGLISAQTGYKGDVSTYQVSVPVQPGNSGGPLFNRNGSLIGIIKAKHSKAENVTYAVKSRNILNLIELLPESVLLSNNQQLVNQPLTSQVKALRRYVFLIKVLEQ